MGEGGRGEAYHTMKKQYIKPAMQVYNIRQSQILCTSNLSTNSGMIWGNPGINDR